MYILTKNAKYIFIKRDELGYTVWAEPYDSAPTLRPTIFVQREYAERVRNTFPEPLRSETELCTLITPF